MATAAQILANQENAQHSTGPRSEAGKAASSANATKTGLTSAKIFVRAGDEPAFFEFRAGLMKELKPSGALQKDLVYRIVHAAWNVRHCMALEAEIREAAVQQGVEEPLLHDETAKKIDRIYRYKRMHESSRRQAMAELRQLQTEAHWREETQEFEDEPILADTAKVRAKVESINATASRSNLNQARKFIEVASSRNVRFAAIQAGEAAKAAEAMLDTAA